VLRDAADTVASQNRGRRMNSGADDVQLEFANTQYAVAAARALHDRFRELACKLNLPTPELCTGIHSGEVTRSRDGDLFGETLGLVSVVRRFAGPGEIVLSDSVVDQLGTKIEVEDLGERAVDEVPERLRCWSLRR